MKKKCEWKISERRAIRRMKSETKIIDIKDQLSTQHSYYGRFDVVATAAAAAAAAG